MSRRKRLKVAKPAAEDIAFARMEAIIDQAQAAMIAAAASVPAAAAAAITKAVTDAVTPYQALLAQQEKDAIVAGHPGWKSADPHRFPGVLT